MLSWLQYHIRQYFGFSRSQTNGVVVLLLCITISLAVPVLVRYYDIRQQQIACQQDTARLEAFVTALDKQRQRTSYKPPAKQSVPPTSLFDINLAAAAQLQQLYKVGPVRARRIIAYRNRLGGFVCPAQYNEVYNLPAEVIARLQKHAFINPDFLPKQLNLNTAPLQALAQHPYLSYGQAKAIVAYRAHHGPFHSVQDLNKLGCVPAQTLIKLSPYLTVAS